MSNYWKKKLDELNQSNEKSSSGSSPSSNYWQDKLTELEKENQKKKEAEKKTTPITRNHGGSGGSFGSDDDIAPVAQTILGTDARDASFWDLTWNSIKRGYNTARLGEESFAEMQGLENDKEAYQKILAGDDYNFAPGNWFEKAVSGAFELGGQMVRQSTHPRTLAIAGSAAGAAAIAGQAGPQVIAPEELISVPGAFIAGMAAGNAGSALEIEAGHAYNEMTEAGISKETASKVALAVGTLNAGLEALQVDELTDAYRVLKGSGATKTFTQKIIDELLERGIDVAKETAQEVVQEGVTIGGVQIAHQTEKGGSAYTAEEVGSRLLDTAKSSALSFGMMNVPAAVNNTVTYGSEQVTKNKLTDNEQKVVDKVVENEITEREKDGTKLTTQEKFAIRKDVIDQMDKGYISTDTIEEVLGDRTSYDSLSKEAEEYDTLYNTASGQLSKAQQDRLAELEAKNKANPYKDALKLSREQYQQSVFELVRGDRLSESYNERARRGQAYQADLTKYDAKQQAVIQKAIDSGILNNTNRTHEFVDMVAKISADKGVPFDFTDNEKLKNSGFAVDGKFVNGYVTKDGVTVNIDSAKSLNSVVGHEITHVLEGTELYQALSEAVKNYAISKEGLDGFNNRLKAIEDMYKSLEADPDAEVVADLVGDYLFTDTDFINNLSTQNRNVFQKIYDEIKYLCKVATAGSKEARELEKVKKAFEKAYREGGNVTGDTKYSMSDSDGKQLSTEQQEYFKDSKMRDENGNLKVMYHGSQDAGFHTFDSRFSDDDTSFFFVDRNDAAATYSGTSEVYEAKTIRTTKDMNNFLAEIGYDQYEAVEKDGKFELLENGDHVAYSDTAQGLYDEFCWYEGVGEGDANYKVYLNLKNPLVVDAKGRPWNKIDAEFSQDVYDKYNSLTAEEKAALIDLAGWEDFRIFNSEIQEARGNELASAYQKMGEDCNIYDLFSVAADNFSEEAMRENARKYLKTRDYAQRAKEQGYDGVIFNNIIDLGGYSNGSEGAATVAIAFDSNQIKSTANAKPTGDADIRYSLSDSEGRQLSKEQSEYFKGSKVTDENGNLKVVYHGSPADFNTFSLKYLGTNGTAEGYGFYFTDKKSIAEGYSKGREGQQNGAPGKLFEVYLDIKKPLSDTKVTMSRAQFKKFLTTLNKQVDADGEPLDILSNYGDVAWEGLNNVLNYVMEIEYDGSDSDVNLVHSIINGCGNMETVLDVLRKTTGYDGIIVENATWGDDQKIYLAFHPEQIKNVDNLNPTTDPDIRKSLSAEGEVPKQYGNYNVYGKDIRLDKGEVAPVSENLTTNATRNASELSTSQEKTQLSEEKSTVSEMESVAPVTEVADMFPDTPMQSLEELTAEAQGLMGAIEASEAVGDHVRVEQLLSEYEAVMEKIGQLEETERQRADSLMEADIPPEMDAPYYSEGQPVQVDNPFEDRDWYNVGNRKVKAYMYENPEVKTFFQEEAAKLLGELNDTTRAERWYNDELYYESGGEKGFGGVKRHTSASMEELLDGWGMSYADIEKGLNAIIEDNGAENIAAAKKLEFMLNDRLLHGYKDFYSNGYIPPNQDYINLLNEKQITEYSKEAFDALMANADQYAPPVADDVAPVIETGTTTETPAIVKPQKSVGAAPYGFDPVTQLQYEYGTIPEGEHPVRDDSLPKSTTGKDKVSLTARTVKGAGATPDGLVDLLDKETVGGRFSYIPIKNSDTVQNAYDKIVKMGWEAARGDWEARVRKGEVSAELTATGSLLLNNAAKAGDRNTWLSVLHDYQIMGTNAGQAVQAMRILKTLTPDDSLYIIERSVDQMVEDMKLGTEIKIDENLKQSYIDAKTDGERDTARKKIAEDVAKQIPSTAMDKWTALRYLNMLGNLRTQGRNILGNLGMSVTSGVKNTVATTMEAVAEFASGGKFHRTKSLFVSKDLLKAARNDFANVEYIALNGGKFNDPMAKSLQFQQEVQDARKIFKFAPLEMYRRATNFAMDKGDLVFSKAAYGRALAGYLKANGITETDFSQIDQQTLDEARAYAVNQAQEQTFRDNNWLSNWVSKVGRRKDTPKIGKLVSEGVMPFRKTPANILLRAEEYSPLGIINTAVKSIQLAKGAENVTGADVVNSLAKTLTGTGLFALGMWLNNSGALSGGPDEDDDKEWFEDQYGWQNYSIHIGDHNFTIDFLSPAAMPLLMGAQLNELRQSGGIELKDLETSLLSIADPMIEMSMLQGVNDTLDNIRYAESNMGQFLINAGLSYLTQGLTNSFLGQIERSVEGQRMSTYVDKDSDLPAWLQKALGKASAKTPGWDYQQIPYVDAWGETEDIAPLPALAENTLSPSYIGQGVSDDLYNELNRLNDAQSDINVYPQTPDKTVTFDDANGNRHEDYNLSAEEYVELAKLQGKTQKELVEEIISADLYSGLTDQEKARAVQLAYQYAREYGRQEVLGADGFSAKWMAEAGDDIVNAIIAHTNDEMTFAYDYPEKYKFLNDNGVSYDDYANGSEEFKDAYNWAFKNPEKFTLSKAVASDVVTYRKYTGELYDIKADKDENGNSISGSKKEKVTDYINNMDLDYGQKIILFRSMYDSKQDKADYNMDIIDYLNSRDDISYDEMVIILKELDFNVSSDGYISWD